MNIGRIIWFWGCFLSFALDDSDGLTARNSLIVDDRVVSSHAAILQNSEIHIQSFESGFETTQAEYKDTNSTPKPIFLRCDSIGNLKSEYLDSLFLEAYQSTWIYADSSGKLIPIPEEIRSQFRINVETGWIPNSLYESFIGGNNLPFYAVKISSLSGSLKQNYDSVSYPNTSYSLRVLLKFDWLGKDTLRNILLLSDESDDSLDLNTILNYWIKMPNSYNIETNRNDIFLPKYIEESDLEKFGYKVFLPEFFIMPLTCFHSPLVIEFWGKNNVTVYSDMDKLEGLTLVDVIPILKSVKEHSELFHAKSCLNNMLKLQLFIKNKNAKGSDFIDFVEDVSELNYILEVKSN